ncbi:MAG: hypothetical protein U0931_35830 [Vulcanimicrobiota bacterium]
MTKILSPGQIRLLKSLLQDEEVGVTDGPLHPEFGLNQSPQPSPGLPEWDTRPDSFECFVNSTAHLPVSELPSPLDPHSFPPQVSGRRFDEEHWLHPEDFCPGWTGSVSPRAAFEFSELDPDLHF